MSKTKTILFRTDSSSSIGTGHIMRDLVLAGQYNNAKIIFATQDLQGNINHKILEAGYRISLLKTNSLKEFINVVKRYRANLVIIDNYSIDFIYEKKLKEQTDVKILAFDDTYEKHYCDILLNHNIGANEKRYKELVPKFCELRCGSNYTLLRDEFYQDFPQKTETKDVHILVAMGGVDSKNLNIQITNILKEFTAITVHIVTTTANRNLAKLKEYVSNNTNIILHINTSHIAKLMHLSNFAIITPSVTLNEVHFMKLPFIAIKTEQNQEDIYKYLQKNDFFTLEKFDKKKLSVLIKKQMEQLS